MFPLLVRRERLKSGSMDSFFNGSKSLHVGKTESFKIVMSGEPTRRSLQLSAFVLESTIWKYSTQR